MKLPIAYYGNPILRKKAPQVEKIDAKMHQLVNDMIETMAAHNGIGLAAPQVHHSLALFIIHVTKDDSEDTWTKGGLYVFFNPKIISFSEELWDCSQGCLSIPKVYGTVTRPLKIVVEATNLQGERFTEEFVGLEAHVIMHENDHINGVLFIDRMKGKERQAIEPLLREIKKKYPYKSC
jgi:peptide deformylase